MSVNLDGWLPEPTLRTRHCRESPTNAQDLWSSATTVRLRDCRVLGRLIRVRIPGTAADLTFDEMFRSSPFNLLEEGPTHMLSGLCGRIWTMHRDFTQLARPEDFLTWQVAGTVRVLFANWAEATDEGSALLSEVRVGAVDRKASLYVRGLRPFIAASQGLVGVEALNTATRRASSGVRR